jgi:hypothetical protein
MANEFRKQKLYDTLRGQVSARLVQTTGIAQEDIADISLGELVNTLFLMHGDGGSTGDFSVTNEGISHNRRSRKGRQGAIGALVSLSALR